VGVAEHTIDSAAFCTPELVEKLLSIPLVVVIHYLIKRAGLIGHFNFPCQQHSCKRTYAEHIFLRSVYFYQRYFLALFTSHCLVLLSDKFLYISVDILEHICHEGVAKLKNMATGEQTDIRLDNTIAENFSNALMADMFKDIDADIEKFIGKEN
jgi:hypothetical protein